VGREGGGGGGAGAGGAVSTLYMDDSMRLGGDPVGDLCVSHLHSSNWG